MIRVRCRTNLDLSMEQWPDELPAVPRVGDEIQSKTKHGQFQLNLQVVRVTWKYCEIHHLWHPYIELHMTETQKRIPYYRDGENLTGSIIAFYSWYAPLVGKSVSDFI